MSRGPSPLDIQPSVGDRARRRSGRFAPRGQLFFVRSFPGQAIYQAPIQRCRRVAVLGGLHPPLDLEARRCLPPRAPPPYRSGRGRGRKTSSRRAARGRAFGSIIRAAELGALASVPGSTEHESRCEAEAGEGITEGAVDEGLVLEAGLLLEKPRHVGETRLARAARSWRRRARAAMRAAAAPWTAACVEACMAMPGCRSLMRLREAPVLDYDRVGREAAEEGQEAGGAFELFSRMMVFRAA